MKKIYFAGGCFWGVQAFFKTLKGVTKTVVGYANSNVKILYIQKLNHKLLQPSKLLKLLMMKILFL